MSAEYDCGIHAWSIRCKRYLDIKKQVCTDIMNSCRMLVISVQNLINSKGQLKVGELRALHTQFPNIRHTVQELNQENKK